MANDPKTYTRGQFLHRLRILIGDLEYDHEEQTGISARHKMDFRSWMDELNNAEENS